MAIKPGGSGFLGQILLPVSMEILRKAFGVPIDLPASAWMLEIGAFLLRTETELIIKSRRVVHHAARRSARQASRCRTASIALVQAVLGDWPRNRPQTVLSPAGFLRQLLWRRFAGERSGSPGRKELQGLARAAIWNRCVSKPNIIPVCLLAGRIAPNIHSCWETDKQLCRTDSPQS
jgi:hypothetical protein